MIAVEIGIGEGVVEIMDECASRQVFTDSERLIDEQRWLIESCGDIFDRGKIEGDCVISCEILNGVEIILLGWIVVRQCETLMLNNRRFQVEDNSFVHD